METKVRAVTENIGVVTEFIDAQLEQLDCPIKTQFQIDIVIDEIFSNIANYGYRDKDEPGDVDIIAEPTTDPSGIKLVFKDNGKPYNPLEHKDPDLNASAEERGIGGLGIFIVKETMDSVDYAFENGQNILTVYKNF